MLVLSQSALAHEYRYEVVLSGATEGTPNSSAGTGTAIVDLDMDLITMMVHVEYSGLSGTVTDAHIYCCNSVAGTGTSGVSNPLPGFHTGVTSGTYDVLVDLTEAPAYESTFITTEGGMVSDALDGMFFGMLDGKSYLELKTSAFPGGEIRGFLIGGFIPESGSETPEPTTLVLTTGTLAAGWLLRRRCNS